MLSLGGRINRHRPVLIRFDFIWSGLDQLSPVMIGFAAGPYRKLGVGVLLYAAHDGFVRHGHHCYSVLLFFLVLFLIPL